MKTRDKYVRHNVELLSIILGSVSRQIQYTSVPIDSSLRGGFASTENLVMHQHSFFWFC